MSQRDEDEAAPSGVSVHPTLGDLEHLRRARAEYDASAASSRPAQGGVAYEPEDVVGGPTVGSLTELRFAHHAHCCEGSATHAAAPRQSVPSTCCCCD